MPETPAPRPGSLDFHARANPEGVAIADGEVRHTWDQLDERACRLASFLRDRLGVHALGHEVMAAIAQHAHDLGGERFVQQLHHGLAIGAIAGGDGTLLDVLACAGANGLDVGQEWLLVGHGKPPLG